jgi:hypothetical protein
MTVALDTTAFPADRTSLLSRASVLWMAASASLGAGAIHAAAVGVHNEHPQAVRTFVAIAAFQLVWGAFALVRNSRTLAAVGALGNTALIGGWVMAKSSGISFIDGMEAKESAQFADTLAMIFAAVAVIGAFVAIVRPTIRPRQILTTASLAAVAVLTIPGMVRAGSHSHAGHSETASAASGDTTGSHNHGSEEAAPIAATTEDTAHAHEDAPASDDTAHHDEATNQAEDAAAHDDHADHVAVEAKPYDPTKPIDLGGVEGVTPEQQAEAENLIAVTLLRLPKFSDPAVAESLGWQSIGDGGTGHEHYINWDIIDDNEWLNPDMPESLVYEPQPDGTKKLVSAMYMLPREYTLDNVPDMGGGLMQWHIHDNLCFTADPALTDEPVLVRGLTNAEGGCNAPFVKLAENAMIHVWITSNPCGPFAALEGVGAGAIAEGEERLCDRAHGAGGGTFG